MLNIEKVEIYGWEEAIRGMRNPKNSWDKSDSNLECECGPCNECKHSWDGDGQCYYWGKEYVIGPNDLNLMMTLRNAGTDHRKFMRMITVYLDITAPFYFWKEFSTYKVGTVANSCSTMHKIADKEFTVDDFSYEHLEGILRYEDEPEKLYANYGTPFWLLQATIGILNEWRDLFNNGGKHLWEGKEREFEPKNKDAWWQIIQLLPTSYNQKRTVMLNYEVLANIYNSRRNHKLDEWHTLCDWIETLPYSELITGKEEDHA